MPTSNGAGLPIADAERGNDLAATIAIAAGLATRRRFSKGFARTRLPDLLCTAAAFAMVFAVVFGFGTMGKMAGGETGQRTALLQPLRGEP